MTPDLPPLNLPQGFSPYDFWSRRLWEDGPERKRLLQPALVRMSGKARSDEGRQQIYESLKSGLLRIDGWEETRLRDYLDARRGAESDFLVQFHWDVERDAEILKRFGEWFEVVERARPVLPDWSDARTVPAPNIAERDDLCGPVVAVIDDGIGFLNARFRRPCGQRTRFHAVWLQAFRTIANPPFGGYYTHAGEILYRPEIDAIFAARGPGLDEAVVYRTINDTLVAPGEHRSLEFSFTHGTGVLDVAAGTDPQSGRQELDWPLIAVQLPPEAVDNTAGWQLEPCIVSGVRWILAESARAYPHRPVVINISFATFAGPKDGTKAIEAQVAALCKQWQAHWKCPALVVYSFGNSYEAPQRAEFRLSSHWTGMDWQAQPDNAAANYAEVRALPTAKLSHLVLQLTRPNETTPIFTGQLLPGQGVLLDDGSGMPDGWVLHVPKTLTAPGVYTPAHYLIALAPTKDVAGMMSRAHAGCWRIELASTNGSPMKARIEVQRGDTVHGYPLRGRQSYLDDPRVYGWDEKTRDYTHWLASGPITHRGTNSSFVTSKSLSSLTVGAVEGDLIKAVKPFKPSPYSSANAATGLKLPHVAALADTSVGLNGTVATGTFSGSTRQFSGTSIAAAQASRTIATELAAAVPPPFPNLIAQHAWLAQLIASFGLPPDPAQIPRMGLGIVDQPQGGRNRSQPGMT